MSNAKILTPTSSFVTGWSAMRRTSTLAVLCATVREKENVTVRLSHVVLMPAEFPESQATLLPTKAGAGVALEPQADDWVPAMQGHMPEVMRSTS
mmetsp:Transcript_16073/g.51448  ORF Transcript_16073/g.51448 Transcript_16073/m.51448 type:complete len:95 (-) Transcript_16073:466-750(-)